MDTRRVCGMDVRRLGVDPEDVARAEMVIARFGGEVLFRPVGSAAVAAEWHGRGGQVVVGVGATAEAALGRLTRTMTA